MRNGIQTRNGVRNKGKEMGKGKEEWERILPKKIARRESETEAV